MNIGVPSDHPSIHYYDGDYPSPYTDSFPENFDETTESQGLAYDLQRYRTLASETRGPILELCCGTGRVAIPLARDGHRVTAVDANPEMLVRFQQALDGEQAEVRSRITLLEQDVAQLSVPNQHFQMAILAFNSLLCISDFKTQCKALSAAYNHLSTGGMLVIDAVNPLQLKIHGDAVPKPFFTRRNPNTGNTYTRFAMSGPFEEDQRQRLYGWYDEIDEQGCVRRRHYSLYWRPIFRYEMELMLQQADFVIKTLEGGHRQEPYTSDSPRMFIQAVRPE